MAGWASGREGGNCGSYSRVPVQVTRPGSTEGFTCFWVKRGAHKEAPLIEKVPHEATPDQVEVQSPDRHLDLAKLLAGQHLHRRAVNVDSRARRDAEGLAAGVCGS